MPAITFNADADFTYTVMSETQTGTVNLKGDLGRVQGQVIFNVYPVPKVPVYVAAGAYFGGDKLLKITGHSADLANPDAQAVIGDSGAVYRLWRNRRVNHRGRQHIQQSGQRFEGVSDTHIPHQLQGILKMPPINNDKATQI